MMSHFLIMCFAQAMSLGLYLEEEEIGVRIEDNVLVTEDGCINLSEEIIKSVEDIEAYMANNKDK